MRKLDSHIWMLLESLRELSLWFSLKVRPWHMMVSLRVVDSKVLRIFIQFEYFFSDKKIKVAKILLHISDGFSSVRVLMYRHSKSSFLQVTLQFWIVNSNFCSFFWLSLPYQFCEKYQFGADGFSLVLVIMYTFNLAYTLKNDQWITIWWAKLELECLVLIFIYSNSNSRSLAKTWTLNAGTSCTSELIPKKYHLQFLTLHPPSCLFLITIL